MLYRSYCLTHIYAWLCGFSLWISNIQLSAAPAVGFHCSVSLHEIYPKVTRDTVSQWKSKQVTARSEVRNVTEVGVVPLYCFTASSIKLLFQDTSSATAVKPTSCSGDFGGDLFLIKTIFRCRHCKARFYHPHHRVILSFDWCETAARLISA